MFNLDESHCININIQIGEYTHQNWPGSQKLRRRPSKLRQKLQDLLFLTKQSLEMQTKGDNSWPPGKRQITSILTLERPVSDQATYSRVSTPIILSRSA